MINDMVRFPHKTVGGFNDVNWVFGCAGWKYNTHINIKLRTVGFVTKQALSDAGWPINCPEYSEITKAQCA